MTSWRERPDVVIVATGGTPDLDWLDGAEHCTSAWDVLTGNVPWAPISWSMTEPAAIRRRRCGTGHCSGPQGLAGLNRCATRAGTDLCRAGHLEAADLRTRRADDLRPRAGEGRPARQSDYGDVPEHDDRRGDGTQRRSGRGGARHAAVGALYDALRARSSNDGVTDIDALLGCAHNRGERRLSNCTGSATRWLAGTSMRRCWTPCASAGRCERSRRAVGKL